MNSLLNHGNRDALRTVAVLGALAMGLAALLQANKLK